MKSARRCDSFLLRTILIGVLAFGYLTTTCKSEDRIKTKLDAAKDAYLKDIQKANKLFAEGFDRQEDVATKAGNKPLLDQIQIQRAAFFENGQPSKNFPPNLTKPYGTARIEMEAAFVVAVKEYTKNKQDLESTAVLSELTEIKRNRSAFLPITTDDPIPAKSTWTGTITLNLPRHPSLPCRFSMESRDGYTFHGVFEILGNGTGHHVREVRGVISGHVLTWQTKQVKPGPGHAGSDTTAACEKETCTFASAEGTAVMKREKHK